MVKMFNIILNTCIFPAQWCIDLIQPIYKNKGSVNEVDNYRGITLLTCMGKLFTSIINERLSSYHESNGVLGEERAGFRAAYSTLDHTFVLHTLIDVYLAGRKRRYCAFIDYKKAFDLINRGALWLKLISSGIDAGKIFRVIQNIYKSAKSCVKSNGVLSNYFPSNVGVRQGGNLSPSLSALYRKCWRE